MKCGEKVKEDGGSGQSREKTRNDWMLEAIKNRVLKLLKAPGTAQFMEFYDIEEDEYGRVYAEIAVDSQNAFGATLRTKIGTVFSNVTDDAAPDIVLEPTVITIISSPKIIKSAGKFGKPPK
jgi:hypothetical protein